MSELFDKEVNAQKESLKKNFRGSRKLPHAHKKCAMKMKEIRKEKTTRAYKCFWWKEGVYRETVAGWFD